MTQPEGLGPLLQPGPGGHALGHLVRREGGVGRHRQTEGFAGLGQDARHVEVVLGDDGAGQHPAHGQGRHDGVEVAAQGVGIVEVGGDALEDPGPVVGLGGLGDHGHKPLALVGRLRGLEGRPHKDDAARRLAADADAGVVVAGHVEPDAVAGGQDEGRRLQEQAQPAAVAVEAAQLHLGVGPDAVGQAGVPQPHHEQVLPGPGPHLQVDEDGADAGLDRHRRRHQVKPVQVARLHPFRLAVGRGPASTAAG